MSGYRDVAIVVHVSQRSLKQQISMQKNKMFLCQPFFCGGGGVLKFVYIDVALMLLSALCGDCILSF